MMSSVSHQPSPSKITPRDSLSALAVKYPAASRVFHRHRLDFCCGGGRTLEEACAGAGLRAEELISEIEAAGLVPAEQSWAHRPLAELVAHILEVYHEPLRPELERLEAMAARVLHVHGDKDPERLGRLATVVHEMAAELRDHMAKEENILFPWINSGRGRTASAPIKVMMHEHEACAGQLREIEELTDGYRPPTGACGTWRALYLGLQEVDEALKNHIHLENNVLFPRALAE